MKSTETETVQIETLDLYPLLWRIKMNSGK